MFTITLTTLSSCQKVMPDTHQILSLKTYKYPKHRKEQHAMVRIISCIPQTGTDGDLKVGLAIPNLSIHSLSPFSRVGLNKNFSCSDTFLKSIRLVAHSPGVFQVFRHSVSSRVRRLLRRAHRHPRNRYVGQSAAPRNQLFDGMLKSSILSPCVRTI